MSKRHTGERDNRGEYIEVEDTTDNGYMKLAKNTNGYMKVARRVAEDVGYALLPSQAQHNDETGYVQVGQSYSWNDLLKTLESIVDNMMIRSQTSGKSKEEIQIFRGQLSEFMTQFDEGHSKLGKKDIIHKEVAERFKKLSKKLNSIGKPLKAQIDKDTYEIKTRTYKLGKDSAGDNSSFTIEKRTGIYGEIGQISELTSTSTYHFDINAIIKAVTESKPPQDFNISIPRVNSQGKKVSKDHIMISAEGAVTWIPGDGNHKHMGTSQIAPSVQKELMERREQPRQKFQESKYLSIQK